MTLYDALNLPPAFLVGLGLIALAIACASVGVYFFGEEGLVEWGLVAKTANFVAWSGLLMVLGFVIFFGDRLTDTHLTELATGLGLGVQSMSWGILNVCSGLMWASGGNLLLAYAGEDKGERLNGYCLIGLGVALVLLGLTPLLGIA